MNQLKSLRKTNRIANTCNRKASRTQLGIESLERRDLMATALMAELVSGALMIEGTTNTETIRIRQVNSALSVDGIQIKVGSTFQPSVSLSSVSQVNVSALGGHDVVDFVGVSLGKNKFVVVYGGTGDDDIYGTSGEDYLYGDSGLDDIYGRDGNDWLVGGTSADNLYGGNHNDELHGESGNDKLFGNAGNDALHGETGDDQLFGSSGTDSLYGGDDNDWMEAGTASEVAVGGNGASDWNAHIWAINGDNTTDVKQAGAGTCVILSALAAAAPHYDLASRITYSGNFSYSVKLYDFWKNPVYETVTFNGSLVTDSTGAQMDPFSATEGEFWTILFQRAYLERFYGINTQDGEAVADFGGEPDGEQAIRALTAKNTWTNSWSFNPNTLYDEVVTRGEVVNAGGTGHRYAVIDIWYNADAVGDWVVKLYNPWGIDAVHNSTLNFAGTASGGVDNSNGGSGDGFIYVNWAEFTDWANFTNYSTSW